MKDKNMNHVQQQELAEAAREADIATPRKATRIRYYMLALFCLRQSLILSTGRVFGILAPFISKDLTSIKFRWDRFSPHLA
jgi:ACS family D-galactonate transporter-like MFS transporter